MQNIAEPGCSHRSRIAATPQYHQGGEAPQETSADEAANASPGGWRVLVVEDLPRIQALIRDVVEQPGAFSVDAFARTEQAAIDAYNAAHHEALIVDLMLAGGSGLGVIKAVRHMQEGPKPLIIVLTNHVSPALERACLQAGADHFLDKSRDFASVRSLLEQARASGLQ